MALILCPECNKEFDNKSYYINETTKQLNYNTHKFCSEECRILDRKKRLTNRIAINCIICGKEFLVTLSQIEHGAKCCSLSCRNEIVKKHFEERRKQRITYNKDYIKLYVGKGLHKRADCRGYVPEHVLVIEKSIGRQLSELEVVHHVNYVHDDNRLENLMLFPTEADHLRYHFATDPRYSAKAEAQKKFRSFNCECCGVEVHINNIAQYNRRKHHYCSKECAGKARQKQVTVTCLHCHKDFEVQEYRKNEVKYCSNSCKIYGSALKPKLDKVACKYSD